MIFKGIWKDISSVHKTRCPNFTTDSPRNHLPPTMKWGIHWYVPHAQTALGLSWRNLTQQKSNANSSSFEEKLLQARNQAD